MSKKKKKIDPLVAVLDLIIIALLYGIIATGINLFFDASHEKQADSFMQDANIMSFELENNDYASLIRGTYVNEINNQHGTSSYHELAQYTEAAFLYKVFDEKGKTVEAEKQKVIMENSRKSMGSLTVFADRIDKMIRDFGKK